MEFFLLNRDFGDIRFTEPPELKPLVLDVYPCPVKCEACGKELPEKGLHFTNADGDLMQDCSHCGHTNVLKKKMFITEFQK